MCPVGHAKVPLAALHPPGTGGTGRTSAHRFGHDKAKRGCGRPVGSCGGLYRRPCHSLGSLSVLGPAKGHRRIRRIRAPLARTRLDPATEGRKVIGSGPVQRDGLARFEPGGPDRQGDGGHGSRTALERRGLIDQAGGDGDPRSTNRRPARDERQDGGGRRGGVGRRRSRPVGRPDGGHGRRCDRCRLTLGSGGDRWRGRRTRARRGTCGNQECRADDRAEPRQHRHSRRRTTRLSSVTDGSGRCREVTSDCRRRDASPRPMPRSRSPSRRHSGRRD